MNPAFPKLKAFLESAQQEWQKMTPGLERIRAACQTLDHPERKFRSVHVAGTNGKGSVCALLEAVLSKAGLKTGLFTSPHLVRVNERFRINEKEITDESLEKLLDKIQSVPEGKNLSFFEQCTLLAFLYFSEQKVDVAILETGLGGRLDATNVVDPVLTILTEIGLDHIEILGPNLVSIAREKAGILKPQVPAVCGSLKEEVRKEVAAQAQLKNAPLFFLNEEAFAFPLNLPGDHQVQNAKIALQAIECLKSVFSQADFSKAVLQKAFAEVEWPARLEYFSKNPPILLDGAHNLEGVEALVKFLRSEKRKWRVLFSAASDKKVAEMLGLLQEVASMIVLCKMKNARSMSPKEIKARCERHLHCPLEIGEEAALEFQKQKASLREGEGLLVTGSLYFIGELKAALNDAHPTNA